MLTPYTPISDFGEMAAGLAGALTVHPVVGVIMMAALILAGAFMLTRITRKGTK